MAFDPTVINFLTVGNFGGSSPDYGVPISQSLVAASGSGAQFNNAGGGAPYTLTTIGNLANLMTLQSSSSYGLVVSVSQGAGGLLARTLTTDGTLSITNATGVSGNPLLTVVPSTTQQLVAAQIGGTPVGSPRNTINFIAGTNIGYSAVDTGSQLQVTINAETSSGIVNGPLVSYTADAALINAQNIGLLTTGLLKNTVAAATGTLSTAVSGTDYLVPSTNLNQLSALTLTNGQLLYYAGGVLTALSPGTVGQVLQTAGATSLGWTTLTAGTIAGNNAWTGTNSWSNTSTFTGTTTFNSSLPTSTQTPTTGAQLITKMYGDGTYGFIAAANAWTAANSWSNTSTFTGTTTFNSSLPTSTQTPTTGAQLITKTYGDGTYGIITAANVWTGAANTFNANPLFPTGASVTNPLSASNPGNYVATCTATTGAWSWQLASPNQSVATVQTTNATTTNVTLDPGIAGSGGRYIRGFYTGISSTNNEIVAGEFQIAYKIVTGTMTQTATPWVTINADTAAVFNAAVVGNQLVAEVNGIAATIYNWTIYYSIYGI